MKTSKEFRQLAKQLREIAAGSHVQAGVEGLLAIATHFETCARERETRTSYDGRIAEGGTFALAH